MNYDRIRSRYSCIPKGFQNSKCCAYIKAIWWDDIFQLLICVWIASVLKTNLEVVVWIISSYQCKNPTCNREVPNRRVLSFYFIKFHWVKTTSAIGDGCCCPRMVSISYDQPLQTFTHCVSRMANLLIYIYYCCYHCQKNPNSSHLYDYGFMGVIPIVRQSKIDFIHRRVIRPLLHGGRHFVLHFYAKMQYKMAATRKPQRSKIWYPWFDFK